MDNAPAANASTEEKPLAPEVLDLFVESKKEETKETKVEPEKTQEATTSDPKEEKKEESKEPEKKPEGEGEPQPQGKFEVNGQFYNTVEEASEAIKKIAGKNSNLSGKVKELTHQTREYEDKVKLLNESLQQYMDANKQWQEYFEKMKEYNDGGQEGKAPKQPEDLKQIVASLLLEEKTKEKQQTMKQQYQDEMDALFDESDIDDILPTFEELIAEQGENPKVSPKKLYERARLLHKGVKEKDLDAIEKEVEERVQRKLTQERAAKGSGTSGSGGGTTPKEKDLNPIILDALNNS